MAVGDKQEVLITEKGHVILWYWKEDDTSLIIRYLGRSLRLSLRYTKGGDINDHLFFSHSFISLSEKCLGVPLTNDAGVSYLTDSQWSITPNRFSNYNLVATFKTTMKNSRI